MGETNPKEEDFYAYLGVLGQSIGDHVDAREFLNTSNQGVWRELDPSVEEFLIYASGAGKKVGMPGKQVARARSGLTKSLEAAINKARDAAGRGPDEAVPLADVRRLSPEDLRIIVGRRALWTVFGIGGPDPEQPPSSDAE